MLTRSLAHDLAARNVAIHAVDPGWVRSRLNPDGAESPASAVEGFWPLLFRHDLAGSGGFWRRGERLPW
jgi:NAD(P)-dependent dehydrogenase (short-subunit alcohol dehydrogenase family)